MFPHADTIYTINALDYPMRLRQAAHERLAASATVDMHPPANMPAPVHRVAATLFGRLRARWGGARRVWLSCPVTTD
jgi:hypothetical protein